jgi:hypothetical protein
MSAYIANPVPRECFRYYKAAGSVSKTGNVEISKGVTRMPNSVGLVEVRQRIDKKKNDAYLASGRAGDCLTQSMRLYLKLRAAGAVRVRGTRAFDRTLENKPSHCWVENKGYVFEESVGVQHIYKKEDYYNGEVIQDVEYAKGMVFEDEKANFTGGRSDQDLTNNQLLLLIQLYERRVDDELYGGRILDETLYQKKFNNVL